MKIAVFGKTVNEGIDFVNYIFNKEIPFKKNQVDVSTIVGDIHGYEHDIVIKKMRRDERGFKYNVCFIPESLVQETIVGKNHLLTTYLPIFLEKVHIEIYNCINVYREANDIYEVCSLEDYKKIVKNLEE